MGRTLNPEIEKALEAALNARTPLLKKLKDEDTDTYRFFSGRREGISGLVIDILGNVGIVEQLIGKEGFDSESLPQIAEWISRHLKLKTVLLKKYIEDRSSRKVDDELMPKKPLLGEDPKEVFSVRENGLRFEIRPYDGFSTGLFLDQRDNRKWVQTESSGKKILNAFAYTCAFSVYAAKGGGQVTSVDLSQKYLDWGKANFLLNDLNVNEHRFYAWDIFEFLKKAKKQGEVFDLIILDPPSFSRSKTGTFALKKDWEKLFEAALPVLATGGTFFYSCNSHEIDPVIWSQGLDRSCESRAFTRVTLPPVPFDFKKEEHTLKTWCAQIL